MRVEYLPAKDENQGPRYYLRPETHEEQKLLTIWRDACMGYDCRLRFIGAEHVDKNIANMPAQPVINAGLCLETRDGKCPAPYLPHGADPLNPKGHTPNPDRAHGPMAAVMARGKTRVTRQGETTVVESGD